MAEIPVKIICVAVTPNTEDPEVGGFFASFVDGWGRGFGFSELEAVFNLVLLKAENEDLDLSAQAGDIITSTAIPNVAVEKALERRYGGKIDYHPNHPLSA